MSKNVKKTLQPGDKIYNLFTYQEVLIKGSKESFLIKIEKVAEEKCEEKLHCHYVRAMG
ncbi:Hypothetical protein LUCI_4794 [Lucifera butyrica]|uniref:Uncharacterized protein n=1 Tax=Lucifera butyrica TaxID=1351585 RepID=A0A498RDU7_9FIRM|nr:hypothetical protein [Lucifera butyrica]VBB09499.1 Hypothetical protein LUCI_4794 [Lucifera butyrica]